MAHFFCDTHLDLGLGPIGEIICSNQAKMFANLQIREDSQINFPQETSFWTFL